MSEANRQHKVLGKMLPIALNGRLLPIGYCLHSAVFSTSKIGIPRPPRSRSTNKSTEYQYLNKSFENKFKRERESSGLGIPFVDIFVRRFEIKNFKSKK